MPPKQESRSSRSSAHGGLRRCLRSAAWLAPLAWPPAVLEFALLNAPWLESLQAEAERRLIALEADTASREAFAGALAAAGGVPGVVLLCLAVSCLWLAVLHAVGVLSVRGLVRRVLGRGVDAATQRSVLAMLAALGVLAFALQAVGAGLARSIDAHALARPTAASSYAWTLGAQLAVLTGLAASLGAVLPGLLGRVRPLRAVGTAAVLAAAVGLLTAGTDAAFSRRYDVGLTLAAAVGVAESAPTRHHLAVVTPDRVVLAAFPDQSVGLTLSEETARRVRELVAAREGRTTVVKDAEGYLLAERLHGLDPAGAQGAAWQAVRWRGAASTTHALLVSLTHTANSPTAREVALSLATDPSLRLGPFALRYLARGLAQQGELERAIATAASLRAHRATGVEPLTRHELHVPVTSRLAGRLVVDGAPFTGRVGLVRPEDLESLPLTRDDASPMTWLLRLRAVAACDASGAFVLENVEPGDHALVFLPPAPWSVSDPRVEGWTTPFPPLRVPGPGLDGDVGEIRLCFGRG